MTAAARVVLGPIPLDPDRRWMVRASAYEVDGEVVPFSLEVRMKQDPCFHDAPPADQDPHIEWERADHCGCWPPAWPGAQSVPPGGLPVRLLRQLRLSDLVGRHEQAVATRAKDVGTGHPRREVTEHFEAVLSRTSRPASGRGRPSLEPAVHLSRLDVLDAAYAKGDTQTRAARRLRLSPAAMRVSLAWARSQEPPLWTSSGRGRRGQLTTAGRKAIDGTTTNQRKGKR